MKTLLVTAHGAAPFAARHRSTQSIAILIVKRRNEANAMAALGGRTQPFVRIQADVQRMVQAAFDVPFQSSNSGAPL